MTKLTRRALLTGAVAATGTVLAGTLPGAVAKTQLEASVEVLAVGLYQPYSHYTTDVPSVDTIVARITNERASGEDSITPIPNVWGVDRETQVAWAAHRGYYPEIQPGEAVTLHLSPPRPSNAVRLKYDEPAVVRVFDKGTERRADGKFVPEELDEVEER